MTNQYSLGKEKSPAPREVKNLADLRDGLSFADGRAIAFALIQVPVSVRRSRRAEPYDDVAALIARAASLLDLCYQGTFLGEIAVGPFKHEAFKFVGAEESQAIDWLNWQAMT